MAIVWTKTTSVVGGATVKYEDDRDVMIIGTGTLAASGVSNSPDIGCRPFASVQVVRTSGSITGQIESDNSGTDANFAANYDEFGIVLPALFSGLSASRIFGSPKVPAVKRNRLKITAGSEGFEGTVYVFASRRGE